MPLFKGSKAQDNKQQPPPTSQQNNTTATTTTTTTSLPNSTANNSEKVATALLDSWNEDAVVKYLIEQGVQPAEAKKFKDEKITGELLPFVDNYVLKEELKIDSLHQRLAILRSIHKLSTMTSMPAMTDFSVANRQLLFSYLKLSDKQREDAVVAKLKKQVEGCSEEDLRAVAKNLSIKDNLKQKYLNKDFKAIKEYFNSLSTKKQSGFLTSQAPALISTNSTPITDTDNSLLLAEMDEKMDQYKLNSGTVKVKLVLAEIANDTKMSVLRRVASPIMTAFNTAPQFGMIHSALIIGPWYLEWNNSALCIPRKCYSSASVLAVDVDAQITKANIEEVIDKIADVIVEWNTTHAYDKGENNCQYFVDDLIKAIGAPLKFGGCVAKYLQKLRSKGSCSIKYHVPAEVQEKCNIPFKKIKFQSHRELDDFVNNLLDKHPFFKEDCKDDYFLLKAFDRAFWLRSNKHELNEAYKPHKCAFGDPELSRSIIKEWF